MATFCYSFLGYPHLIDSFTSFKPWQYHVPDIMYGMMYILCVVLCFAVTVMGAWHIYGVTNGETSVEGQDNEMYSKRAKDRDQACIFYFLLCLSLMLKLLSDLCQLL